MSEKLNQVKNQHYVPQMLLRGFAVNSTNGRMVSVYNLEKHLLIPSASIKGQCSKNYYYGSDGTIEKKLGKLEAVVSNVFRDIVKSKTPPRYGSEDWLHLNTFFATQFGRTPGSHNLFIRRILSIKEQAIKSLGPNLDENLLKQIEEQFFIPKNSHLINLKQIIEMAPILQDLSDILIVNESDFDFLMNDVGVITHNHWTTGFKSMGSDGFASKGLILIMPISSRELILKYDSSVYNIPGNKKTLAIKENYRIKKLNEIQVIFAEKNVYFNGANNLGDWLKRNSTTILRYPLSKTIVSERLVSDSGKGHLVHSFSSRPNLSSYLDWLSIKPPQLKVPKQERVRKYRDEAMRINEEIFGKPKVEDPSLNGMTFTKIHE